MEDFFTKMLENFFTIIANSFQFRSLFLSDLDPQQGESTKKPKIAERPKSANRFPKKEKLVILRTFPVLTGIVSLTDP
jgi:hypothetical protein